MFSLAPRTISARSRTLSSHLFRNNTCLLGVSSTPSQDRCDDSSSVGVKPGRLIPCRRQMSTNNSGADNGSSILPSFGSKPITPDPTVTTDAVSVATSSTSDSAALIAEQIAAFEPTWWPSDQALVALNWINETAGFPCYAYSIMGTTLAFRFLLFPIFVKGQRNSSRMAHVQPEMKKIMDQMEKQKGKGIIP